MNTRTKRAVPSAPAVSQETAANLVPVEVPSQSRPEPAMQQAAIVYPPKIAAAIVKITRDIGKIVKDGKNTFHNYSYAKWDDILDKLAPMIAEEGLIIIPSELSHNLLEAISTIAITYEFTIINADGDVWPMKPKQTQICMVKNNKGVVDDKAASKCFTQAQKYMMLALFKIRTADMADADASDTPTPPRTGRRIVPSSTGKLPPHTIEIVNGEQPAAWAERFIAAIAKADSETEIDAWDKANDPIIRKVEAKDVASYNKLVDALNANHERVRPKAADQGFAPPATKPASALTDDERDWINGLDGAFSGCEDTGSLDAEYDRLAEPQINKVSIAAKDAANTLYNTNRNRIETNE